MATADREPSDREPGGPRGTAAPALPNARLNPLLNPLLAKQLGRWAHIYYTASVDKREAAIEKLVCELEAEEARQTGAPSPAPPVGDPSIPLASRNTGPVLVALQHPEPSPPEPRAVESLAVGSLRTGRTAVGDPPPREPVLEPVFESPVFEPAAFERPVSDPPVFAPDAEESHLRQPEAFATPVPHTPPQAPEQIEVSPAPVAESWQELLRRTGSAPPEDRWQTLLASGSEVATNAGVAGVSKEDQASTQTSRAFDDLLAQSEPTHFPAPPARSLRGAWIAAAVLLVFGGAVWIARSPRSQPAATERTVASEKPVAPPLATAPSATPPASSSAAAPPIPVPETRAPRIATATPPAAQPNLANRAAHAAPPAPQAQSTDTNPPTDPELLAGMRELQGNGVPRNSAEAARHLWLSVKNQNGSALILLAGLYAQGDGVAKDCDQAKILLDAAGRQAKSHSQFQRVETTRATLRTSGCE